MPRIKTLLALHVDHLRQNFTHDRSIQCTTASQVVGLNLSKAYRITHEFYACLSHRTWYLQYAQTPSLGPRPAACFPIRGVHQTFEPTVLESGETIWGRRRHLCPRDVNLEARCIPRRDHLTIRLCFCQSMKRLQLWVNNTHSDNLPCHLLLQVCANRCVVHTR
jgi:hypothetical protein